VVVKDQVNDLKCDIKASGYTLVQRGYNDTALNSDWIPSKGDFDTSIVSFIKGADTVDTLTLDFLVYNMIPIVTYDVVNGVVCRLSDPATKKCT